MNKKSNITGKDSVLYYIVSCLTDKYASDDGRASLKEYWSFTLFILFIYAVVLSLCCLLINRTQNPFYMMIMIFVYLILCRPSYAVLRRRMHDIGRTGSGYFISTASFLALFKKGDDEENLYGPPPFNRK